MNCEECGVDVHLYRVHPAYVTMKVERPRARGGRWTRKLNVFLQRRACVYWRALGCIDVKSSATPRWVKTEIFRGMMGPFQRISAYFY